MEQIEIKDFTDLNNAVNRLCDALASECVLKEKLVNEKWVFDSLPPTLAKLMAEIKSDANKDTALYSVLVILSGLIKDYEVFYDDKLEGCQLYVYILGDPAQGKGSVAKYMELGSLFHKELLDDYKHLKEEYKACFKRWEENERKCDEPEKPLRKMLFIAGNNSKASLIKDLQANDGFGIIFETETDTCLLYTSPSPRD